ncbi:MAG TPA: sugar ABC transporter permease [Acholeplasmatales bacterium]|nr:sugar ABC transporter permease [Acholeplasmatales bacterium]
MAFLIQQTVIYTIPLMIVALAGVFAERSGIINIALEGLMVMGAFIGVLFVRAIINLEVPLSFGQPLLILGMLVSILGGCLFALLLGYAAINQKADQTIGGSALNLLAPALVLFFILLLTSQSVLNIDSMYSSNDYFMLNQDDFGLGTRLENPLGVVGNILFNKTYITTWICLALYIGLSVILYKTKFGLRLRSCGENPQASASVGINVYKMRYSGILISGGLAGLGGFVYAVTIVAASSNGDVAGFGFLALAVMIFGNWKPRNIAGAALLFGLLKCISVGYPYIDINNDGIYLLNTIGISQHIYRILPYLITLIVLAFTSKKSRAPKAEGIPYDTGKR